MVSAISFAVLKKAVALRRAAAGATPYIHKTV